MEALIAFRTIILAFVAAGTVRIVARIASAYSSPEARFTVGAVVRIFEAANAVDISACFYGL